MKTYNVDSIADFFLTKADPDVGDGISNLKLQKLVYYAAGIFSVVRGVDGPPLFNADIEAWQHGPVVRSLYFRFNEHGSSAIPAPVDFDFSVFDASDLAVLDDVYEAYGQFSAWKLRNMTHEEPPWVEAFSSSGKRISRNQLFEFFSDEVDGDYIGAYQERSKKQERVQGKGTRGFPEF